MYKRQGIKYVDFEVKEYPKKGKSGAIPPRISEPATMMVLNAVLKSKKVFKSEEDIFVDDVYKELEELFSNQFGHKLDEWIYTFYQQNKLFFANYSKSTWADFKHNQYKGQRDPQVFFKEHLKTLEKAPGIKAGTYEQWNPADLYAVKRSEESSLEKEITEASKSPNANTLMKLNAHIVKLMEKKELVGISLKKVNFGDNAEIHLYNVDLSDKLKMKFYYDTQASESSESLNNIGLFAGYKSGGYSIGAEYNKMENGTTYKNPVDNHNLDGISIYNRYSINDKYEIFARYDQISSNVVDGATTSWNYDDDGSLIIIGTQYKANDGVKFSLNGRSFSYENLDTNLFEVYFNVEFKL